jgi:hypothetical protein
LTGIKLNPHAIAATNLASKLFIPTISNKKLPMGSPFSRLSSLSFVSFQSTRLNEDSGARGSAKKSRRQHQAGKIECNLQAVDVLERELKEEANLGRVLKTSSEVDSSTSAFELQRHMITRASFKNEASSRIDEASGLDVNISTCNDSNRSEQETIENKERQQKRHRASKMARSSELKNRRQASPMPEKTSRKGKAAVSTSRHPSKTVASSSTEPTISNEGMDGIGDLARRQSQVLYGNGNGSQKEWSKGAAEHRNEHLPEIGSRNVTLQRQHALFSGPAGIEYHHVHADNAAYRAGLGEGSLPYLQPPGVPLTNHNLAMMQHYAANAAFNNGQQHPGVFQNWQPNFGFLPVAPVGSFQQHPDHVLPSFTNPNAAPRSSAAKNLYDRVINVVSSKTPPAEEATTVGDKHHVTASAGKEKGSTSRKTGDKVRSKRSKAADRAAHQARPANPCCKSPYPVGEETVTKSKADMPLRRFSHGSEVYAVDEENKVFVVDLVDAKTCDLIVKLADEHCARVEKNGNHAASWRTLYTYSKMDLPCVSYNIFYSVCRRHQKHWHIG